MVVTVFRPRLHYIFRRPLDSARALPYFAHGTLLWYCTQHGLFAQKIDAHKK